MASSLTLTAFLFSISQAASTLAKVWVVVLPFLTFPSRCKTLSWLLDLCLPRCRYSEAVARTTYAPKLLFQLSLATLLLELWFSFTAIIWIRLNILLVCLEVKLLGSLFRKKKKWYMYSYVIFLLIVSYFTFIEIFVGMDRFHFAKRWCHLVDIYHIHNYNC